MTLRIVACLHSCFSTCKRHELRQNKNDGKCNEHNKNYPVNHSLNAHVIRYRGLFYANNSRAVQERACEAEELPLPYQQVPAVL